MLTTSPIANTIAGAVAAATRTQLTTLSVPSAALAASATGAKDASGNRVEREVIIQLPFPKLLRNKSMQCRPVMMTKGISCRPLACHKEMQTGGCTNAANLCRPAEKPMQSCCQQFQNLRCF